MPRLEGMRGQWSNDYYGKQQLSRSRNGVPSRKGCMANGEMTITGEPSKIGPNIAINSENREIYIYIFSAPESERKPLSTLISQVFVYRFEPGSFLPPWSGLSVTVIKVWFTLRMSAPESISR